MPKFDLQSHSVHSDGALEPAEVVRLGAAAGMELLALTDHDTVAGVAEALDASTSASVNVVPAVEISALDGDHQDLHVLGYLLDHEDRRLRETLAAYRADRDGRAGRMVVKLEELGYHVDRAMLEARTASGSPVGRPHIAAAVLARPENCERLAAEGTSDVSGFIATHLIQGKDAFTGRTYPSVGEAIEAIHEASGVAVWAHPFWDVETIPEVLAMVDRFVAAGLDGVEVFYTTHTRAQTEALHEHCNPRGLLMTGSADFHGPEHRLFRSFGAFEAFGLEPRLGPIGAP
ncbi:MAG TPA: PHP domain-containing protein [Thermoleophilaceae bacterium]|nr:PHP domain-containing protein [Thermoleophilaceae bacterium]